MNYNQGGGFIPDNNHEYRGQDNFGNSQAEGNSQGKKRNAYGNGSICPVTIKQLFNIIMIDGERLQLDGEDIFQVTVVGKILSLEEHTTNVQITIDDGTGIMEVKVWVDPENQNDAQTKQEWSNSDYIRIYGAPRKFGKSTQISANTILPVRDHNEITFHLLEVIHVYLNRKGSLMNNQSNFNNANNQDNWFHQNNSNYNGNMAANVNMSNLSPLQQMIVNFTQNDQGLHGANVTQMLEHTPGTSPQELRNAIQQLVLAGIMYETIDDQHYTLTAKG